MPTRRRFGDRVHVLVCVVLAATAIGAAPSPAPPALDAILARAAAYVAHFATTFSDVVSEERYIQQAQGKAMVSRTGRAATATAGAFERRELLSDFLLVKVPGDVLVPFRDVFQVDGRPVRDRDDRLSKLFLHPTVQGNDQIQRIVDEANRYNIGDVQRTINTPLLALWFLDEVYQPRFRFTLGKEDASVGPDVWRVDFREHAHPTVVRSPDGRDIPAGGRLWIEAATGRVLKTELLLRDSTLRAQVITSYRPDDQFNLNVPFEMVEDYGLASNAKVSGRANYGRFRRFSVTAVEAVQTKPARWMTEPTSGMVLVEIPPGSFAMGSPTSERSRSPDELVHDVSLDTPYYLGRSEVTQQEWRTVMGSAPSRFADCGPRCPVENVTFDDVQRFLAKLNAGPAKDVRYRLPTEAEWEYACRAGTASPFSSGAIVTTAQVNIDGRRPYDNAPVGLFRGRPTPAGSFEPNPWGLADMHGNVSEWTADWYAPYEPTASRDPHGASSGTERVVRGGSWEASASRARCAARSKRTPADRSSGLGFRIAADLVSRP